MHFNINTNNISFLYVVNKYLQNTWGGILFDFML